MKAILKRLQKKMLRDGTGDCKYSYNNALVYKYLLYVLLLAKPKEFDIDAYEDNDILYKEIIMHI